MKRYLIYIIATLTLACSASCNKAQMVVYDGPDYIMFSDTLYTFGVVDNEEYFDVTICATKPSNKNRNVGVEVLVKESDAIYGHQFRLESSTVTIPAGKLTTSVRLRGYADNIEINKDVRLALRLVTPKENQWDLYGTDTKVELRKCLPYDRNNFVGYMMVTSSYALTYLPDYKRVIRSEADPDDENGLILRDFMYDGYDVKVHLDPTDRLNPLLTFKEQVFAGTDVAFGTKYGDGNILMYQPSGYVSYYSTGENFLAIYMTLYVKNVGTVGTFANVCEMISEGDAQNF